MHRLQFVVPVRIVAVAGEPVVEIYGVESALAFLQNWPVGRQGPVFQAAMNCCFGAANDLMSAEDARKSFADSRALPEFSRLASEVGVH